MIARIKKKEKSVRGTIQLPPSKSIYNRALIIRALCSEDFKISPSPSANDSLLLEKILQTNLSVIDAEDAGTAFRFLTAYLSQKLGGEWLLTGTERMQNRPIAPLVAALKQLGADITYAARENFPPLLIHGKKLKGGSIEIDGSISSQFISALLLIAPTLEGGIQLQLRGEVFSRPYIEMTLKLMHGFGIKSGWSRNTITVQQQKYIPKDFLVEADWSAASYWYEAAALSEEASITLTGLNQNSIQGDSVISELMQQFTVRTEFLPGAIRITKQPSSPPSAFSYNFRACPDLVQAMAVTCAALGTEAALGGVENLRIKETDRLRAMLGELSRLGITAHIASSTFYIPSSHMSGQQGGFAFETYNDHRMAMCLAPLALKLGMVEIKDCEVVKKSYPGFWDDLALAGFEISFL